METNSLKICLQQLLEQHQELVVLGEKKKNVLIQGQAKELAGLVHQESQRVRTIQALERERKQQMEFFSTSVGFQGELSLQECISLIQDEQERQALSELRNNLRSVAQRLKRLNDLNQQLIQQSLDYIENTMELYLEARVQGKSTTYRPPQHQQNVYQQRHFLDSKI